jgi:ATP-binding cassette subfamily F protein 3
MRLNLAQALIARADVLLLDEPTNHLDLDTVMWLEEWLRRYPGTLLVISHDRDFLDGVATHVLHFEASRVRLYTGNYTAFEVQRAQALALQQAAHQKQQREIARVRSFVDRFRAKATKARQAQSRLKLLARMQEIAPAHVDSPFTFGFRGFDANPSPLLALESVRAGYGDMTVLSGVNCALLPGARIGLLGRNGAGKSTFIRLLAGTLAPLSGRVRAGRGLAVGYFAQHQLEQLREEDTALGHLAPLAPNAREQDLRTFLGSFGFSSEEALSPVGHFSGGEKARLTLALIVWQRPNLLLLDEPTNHLDIDMRYALTQALQEYEGAVVLVSHDRHLLRATADDFLLVADGRVEPFPGDLDDYRAWLDATKPAATRPADGGVGTRREERRTEAERRNALGRTVKPLEVECRRLEAEMSDLAARKEAADAWLASETAYGADQRERLRATLREQGECLRRLEACESRWLELQGEIEALARS